MRYNCASGSLEIFGAIARIYVCIALTGGPVPLDSSDPENILYGIGSAIFLIFACLKIHGIRVENNKLLGTYLGFRYGLFFLYIIHFFILSILNWSKALEVAALIVGIIYFILDIGLTVILQSIRVDRDNTAETENQMKNF